MDGCEHRIHVREEKRRSHIDHVDPIEDSVGHLEKDIGIKKEIIYSILVAEGGVISA